MLKKRLVGVVLVKDGLAVQSIGYKRYLPLGKPEYLVENLDRWGADEILIQVIDHSLAGLEPDYHLLDSIAEIGIHTPLIYAGGIKTVQDGLKIVKFGADRIVFESLLHDNLPIVKELSNQLGAQALIASMALSLNDNSLNWLDHRDKSLSIIPCDVLTLIRSGFISEVFISDWMHDGIPGGFNQNLIHEFPSADVPIIAFGGISNAEQIGLILQSERVSAVAIGNFLSYREHSIQNYKRALTGLSLRPPLYQSSVRECQT